MDPRPYEVRSLRPKKSPWQAGIFVSAAIGHLTPGRRRCTIWLKTHVAAPKRILLIAATTGYQTQMFAEAAEKIGFGLLMATDRCRKLDDPWGDHAIPVRFDEPSKAAAALMKIRPKPDGIVAVGDRPTVVAAAAARALEIPYNSPQAVVTCRSKYASHERFRAAGLPVASYFAVPIDADPRGHAPTVRYPCVLKPLCLSASRGVIRADTEHEFVEAFERIRGILADPDILRQRDELNNIVQVEEFIPGREYALEGLVTAGRLQPLAIFEKPDPLDGPYFEESIYVTPPRVPLSERQRMTDTVRRAVTALGVTNSPIHAEFRVNEAGVWMLEVAARPIGGLCAKALRFQNGTGLEELILRHAAGEDVSGYTREESASGVMMIPIPANGIYQSAEGINAASSVPHITEVAITAKEGQRLRKLPEGNSYLGFIFGKADTPDLVENALRTAHSRLQFHIAPELSVMGSRSR
jgi:biotin carboxylase